MTARIFFGKILYIFIFLTGDPKKLAGKNDFSKNKNESTTPTEKKDWNKFKKEKKELRKTRKVTKSNVDQIHEAKQIYEKLKW